MAVNCPCPIAAALTSVTAETCGISLNQIQRIGISRLEANFTNADDANDIVKLAAWQTKIAASDSTKIVLTPLIGGDPIIDGGDPLTTGGGDNSTLNGIEQVTGRNPSLFSCVFNNMTARNERELKGVACETRLRVYLFLQGGNIAVSEITVGGDPVQGFIADTPFLSDRNVNGFGADDTHDFRFSLQAGWSENLKIFVPEFDPFTAI